MKFSDERPGTFIGNEGNGRRGKAPKPAARPARMETYSAYGGVTSHYACVTNGTSLTEPRLHQDCQSKLYKLIPYFQV